MKLGVLRLPDGPTMKNMRSKSSGENSTSGCFRVWQLELGDGGAVVVGVKIVCVPLFMEDRTSCAEGVADTYESRPESGEGAGAGFTVARIGSTRRKGLLEKSMCQWRTSNRPSPVWRAW